MPLRIFNSLTRRKETFIPVGGEVKFFVCGPTVYDYIHLGHARTYIAFDIIARYLRFAGYRVRFLMNITDVADRVIHRAQELRRQPLDLAHEFEAAFKEDMLALGIKDIDGFERASDYIPQMIGQISGLITKGFAYETETGVYFEVDKFPNFGRLSGLTRQELGLKRLELCSSKRHPEDFSLWRKTDQGLRWESPWGLGRPGWHVEDTAISMTHFGDTYDLHGGASELIFPHHEAEIAQAEALSGKAPFVRFWIHTGLLTTEGRKMSKSLGNVIRVRDILKQYTPSELRYYFASHHYRQPVVMSDAAMQRSRDRLNRFRRNFEIFMHPTDSARPGKAERLVRAVERAELEFSRHMNDDFDTPRALGILTRLVGLLSTSAKGAKLDDALRWNLAERVRGMAAVFGILP